MRRVLFVIVFLFVQLPVLSMNGVDIQDSIINNPNIIPQADTSTIKLEGGITFDDDNAIYTVYGIYINSKIDKYCEDNEIGSTYGIVDENITLFWFNWPHFYSFKLKHDKTKLPSFFLFKQHQEKLFTLGTDDLVIMKDGLRSVSYHSEGSMFDKDPELFTKKGKFLLTFYIIYDII